jgi:hypothetical protein
MDFYLKLPRNKKEFALFVLIISVISVNTIAPLITCFETGFTFVSYLVALKIMPFIWLAVVALVLLTYKPCEWLTHKITKKGDSFRSVITINILVTVFVLSIFLTIIGTWIGGGNFFYNQPRNFAIALGVELLIAQPIARFFMSALHKRM